MNVLGLSLSAASLPVSSVEGDSSGGMLSVEYPIGAALLGRVAGQTVEVDAPGGPIRFTIAAVEDAVDPDAEVR